MAAARSAIVFSNAVSYTHLRMRFMDMVMEEVMRAAGNDMAVLVKTNMRDGFKGGMEIDEAVQGAKRFVPVSYTHLDVYKRQVGCHGRRHRNCSRSEH